MWGAIKKAINSNLSKSLDVLIQEKTTETNNKIDSVDSKVQTGNNTIGATNNTGGSTISGTVFAKLNRLLTDWTTTRAGYLDTINANVGTLINGRVVKSVQRGVTTSFTIPLSPINPLKSQVTLYGTSYASSSQIRLPYVQSITSTQLILNAVGFGSGESFSWQVIEFY